MYILLLLFSICNW